jgi:DNA (cytosine-5)-methyltransferase 1
MDDRPWLIDFYCCEGGASVGYHRAGWRVVGVDKEDQPNYPFPFHRGDALDVMRRLIDGEAIDFSTRSGEVIWLTLWDIVAAAASPPCQAHSTITPDKSKHVDLIPNTRELLIETRVPYIIENVEGAKRALENPVRLCGSSFGLRVRRHRMFESNVYLTSIPCAHGQQGRPTGVYGDHPQDDSEYRRPDGTRRGAKATSIDDARDAMGMPWASWHGTTQAIPPAYTEFLGRQLLAHVREKETPHV